MLYVVYAQQTRSVEPNGGGKQVVKGSEYLLNCVCVMLVRAGNLEPRDVLGSW